MKILRRRAIFYLLLFSRIRTCDAFVVNPQPAPALGRRLHSRRPTALVRRMPFVVDNLPSHAAVSVDEGILERIALKTKDGGTTNTLGDQPLVGLTPIPSEQLESRASTMLNAALSGELDNVELEKDPIFGLSIPKTCPGVPDEILNPCNTWKDKKAYNETAMKLRDMFRRNFDEKGMKELDIVEVM